MRWSQRWTTVPTWRAVSPAQENSICSSSLPSSGALHFAEAGAAGDLEAAGGAGGGGGGGLRSASGRGAGGRGRAGGGGSPPRFSGGGGVLGARGGPSSLGFSPW